MKNTPHINAKWIKLAADGVIIQGKCEGSLLFGTWKDFSLYDLTDCTTKEWKFRVKPAEPVVIEGWAYVDAWGAPCFTSDERNKKTIKNLKPATLTIHPEPPSEEV